MVAAGSIKEAFKQTDHCCKLMVDFLEDKRIPIGYSPVMREYYIPLKGSGVLQCFSYCPWCGVRLPPSLRDEYFDIIKKEYRITDRHTLKNKKKLPLEFKSDKWWKKRKIEKDPLEIDRLRSRLKSRNILHEIYERKITEKEARKFYDELMKTDVADVAGFMGLDMGTEWTAYIMYGISFKILAKWRYEGWPTACVICEKNLDIEAGGWRAFKYIRLRSKIRRNVIVHWACYQQLPAEQKE